MPRPIPKIHFETSGSEDEMGRTRYLTKSRYAMALECPTKLFYADQPLVYDNKRLDDAFLQALAHGGFQVGALAKLYFPGGVEVSSLDHDTALLQTSELLQQDRVVIYEAAFAFDRLFVRTDILVKDGSNVDLIEVKAKSFDPRIESFFDERLSKRKVMKLVEKWRPYLYDIAFQSHVARAAHSKLTFTPHLMLVDKSSTTSVDGLNQRFLLVKENGHTSVKFVGDATLDIIGSRILCQIDVSTHVDLIHQGQDLGEKSRTDLGMPSFADEAKALSESYAANIRIPPRPSSKCKHCEFRSASKSDQKSGFRECWSAHVPQGSEERPMVFDIWNFRKADTLIEAGKILIDHVEESDVAPKASDGCGISSSQRQWLQVRLAREKSKRPYVDTDGLRREIRSWTFPLHFIDFETASVAIPFNAGRRPYELTAFQFSHHVVHPNGRIEHVGQYMHDERGEFPNFKFVRALKADLERDSGTILRYASHENTVLCKIREQLESSNEHDKAQLMQWIKSVTRSPGSAHHQWVGSRVMVDLLDVLKRFYYHPLTNGSNSIKRVLPAILAESAYLRTKYREPLYGAAGGIPSLNFANWTWLKTASNGDVVDPYLQLPPIFDGVDLAKLEFTLMGDEELADGGAAMTAFAKMQFTEMSGAERTALRAALLRYCELDTLAMVMLYEHWLEMTGELGGQSAA